MNDSRSQDDHEDPQRPPDGAPEADDAIAEAADADASGDEAGAEAAADADGAADTGTAPEPGAEPAAAPPARTRGGRVVGVLALLLALAAAGAAGWLGWRLYQLEQRLARVPEERAAALADYARAAEVAALENRLATLSRTQQEQQATTAEMRESIQRVQEAFASLRELAGRDQVGWRMAEVRYLLTVAARRLALARDVDAAIAALEGADDALASLGDARLLPLRERIVADLEALRGVEPADVEGIALRLRSLERRVAGLPVQRVAAAEPAADDGAAADTGGSWWHQVKRQLARFVVVRRDERPEPAPAPAADALAPGEALHLALADATRAALARDPGRYREAMDQAIGIVRERFAADTAAAAAFLERLETLRARPVRSDVPDLTPTLELAGRLSARLQHAAEAARGTAADDARGGGD